MITLLISLQDIQEFKSITSNIDTTKSLEPYIHDAQEMDLRAFLGEELYIDLLDDYEASPSLDKYSDLFNGVTYTYQGVKRKHEGLKAVLVHFTYYRYCLSANTHSTKFGLVNKKNDWSDQAPEKQIVRIANQAKSQAVVYQERVKKYLDIYSDTLFEFWRFGTKRKKGVTRITPVGGNSKGISRYNCKRCGRKSCNCDNETNY